MARRLIGLGFLRNAWAQGVSRRREKRIMKLLSKEEERAWPCKEGHHKAGPRWRISEAT